MERKKTKQTYDKNIKKWSSPKMANRTIQMKRHEKTKTVTAKSVQKKWQRNIFLIDSGSTEQQVLHIRYLKFHQETAVLQNDENKHLGPSVELTNYKPAVVQHVSKTPNPLRFTNKI